MTSDLLGCCLSGEENGYPEVRVSTQEVSRPGVKAEAEPLKEGSERQWWTQHNPGTVLQRVARDVGWSAQALVQVGGGEQCIGSQAHSQEASDQGGANTPFPVRSLLRAPSGGGVHYTGGGLR